jgi:formate dehydrogenase major subunit
MINYILEKEVLPRTTSAKYTNAALIVGKDFDFKDGLFSGLRPADPDV